MNVFCDLVYASCYDQVWAYPQSLCQLRLKSIFQNLKMGQPARVLDVGCGPGHHTIFLHGLFDGVTIGLDMSIEMLKRVQEKMCEVELLQASGEFIPLAGSVIDLTFMSYVLHQVGAKQKLISEACRVLKNEGHIAILTSSHDQLKNEPLHQYFPGILEANLRRFPDIADVEGMLVEAGFKNVHSSTISIPRDMSTTQMIALARGKCISVLKLLSEDKFQNGLSIFEKRLKSKYNDKVRYQDSSSLIIADKLG